MQKRGNINKFNVILILLFGLFVTFSFTFCHNVIGVFLNNSWLFVTFSLFCFYFFFCYIAIGDFFFFFFFFWGGVGFVKLSFIVFFIVKNLYCQFWVILSLFFFFVGFFFVILSLFFFVGFFCEYLTVI